MLNRSKLAAIAIVSVAVAFLFTIAIISGRESVRLENASRTEFEKRTEQFSHHPEKPPAHDLADLRAQERMADSAELLANLTIAQLVIGALGTAVVVFTLHQNGRIIEHSSQQIMLNRTQGYHQLRAYISIEKFKIVQERPGFWRTHATVKNVGQTPALNVKVWFRTESLSRATHDIPWDTLHAQGVNPHQNMLAPGGSMGPTLGRTYTPAVLHAAAAQTALLWTTVLVEYQDVFGNTYHRRASMIFTGANFFKQKPTPDGNEEIVLSYGPHMQEIAALIWLRPSV